MHIGNKTVAIHFLAPEAEFHKQLENNSFISESNQDSSHSSYLTRKLKRDALSEDKEGGFKNARDWGGRVGIKGQGENKWLI